MSERLLVMTADRDDVAKEESRQFKRALQGRGFEIVRSPLDEKLEACAVMGLMATTHIPEDYMSDSLRRTERSIQQASGLIIVNTRLTPEFHFGLPALAGIHLELARSAGVPAFLTGAPPSFRQRDPAPVGEDEILHLLYKPTPFNHIPASLTLQGE